MNKIAGICERIKKWWQSSNLWVFVVLVFLFVLICWIADHANGSYRYLSTASIVVSIALSLVVIGYTLAQNVKADIAQDRMERLVERVEDRIRKDVDQLKEAVTNNAVAQVEAKEAQTNVEDGNRYIGKGKVYLSFLSTSDIARLFTYFLLRSNTLGKALSIDKFTPIVDPLLKMPTSEVETYVLGILQGMMCGLEQHLEIVDQKNVRLKELPERFEEHMKVAVSRMKDRNPDIEASLNKIDAIQ